MLANSKSSPSPTPREETGNNNHRRCGATTKNGQPCSGRPSESGFCFAHDPALSSTRESARVRGGKNSSSRARLEKLMPERLRPTFELLEKAVNEVYEGRLPPQRASAMASLAGTMVKIIKAGEKADGNFSLPPQFHYKGIEEFYAAIRGYRRIVPPLAGLTEESTKDEVDAALDAWEAAHGHGRLPTESI